MIDLFKAEWVSSVCVQVSRNGRTDQVWVQLFYYFVFDDSMLLGWVVFFWWREDGFVILFSK